MQRLRWTAATAAAVALLALAQALLELRLPAAQRAATNGRVAAALAVCVTTCLALACNGGHQRALWDQVLLWLAGALPAEGPAAGGGNSAAAAAGAPATAEAAVAGRGRAPQARLLDSSGSWLAPGPAGAPVLASGPVDGIAVCAQPPHMTPPALQQQELGPDVWTALPSLSLPPPAAGAESAACTEWALFLAGDRGDVLGGVLSAAAVPPAAAPVHRASGADYVSPLRRMRLYVKVPGVDPGQVTQGLVGRLAATAAAADMHVTNVCVRAGCIELLVELAAEGRADSDGGAAAAETAAAMVDALGVPLPDGTRLCVQWGEEQVYLVQQHVSGGWAAVAAEASGLQHAGPCSTAATGPLPLLSVRPQRQLVAASSEATAVLLTLSLQCRCSRSLLPGESLVVTQCGRVLVSQLGLGSSSGSSRSSSRRDRSWDAELLVSGVDLTLPGLLRVELRGAGGAAAGSVGVLVSPDAAVAREVGRLEAELEALAGAHSVDGVAAAQALQHLLADLGAWFEFSHLHHTAAAPAAHDSSTLLVCVAGSDGGAAGPGAVDAAAALDLRPSLRSLAATPRHRQRMGLTLQRLLDFALQRAWGSTVQHMLEGACRAGIEVEKDSKTRPLPRLVACDTACSLDEIVPSRLAAQGEGISAGHVPEDGRWQSSVAASSQAPPSLVSVPACRRSRQAALVAVSPWAPASTAAARLPLGAPEITAAYLAYALALALPCGTRFLGRSRPRAPPSAVPGSPAAAVAALSACNCWPCGALPAAAPDRTSSCATRLVLVK